MTLRAILLDAVDRAAILEQQLADVNSKLNLATVRIAELEARIAELETPTPIPEPTPTPTPTPVPTRTLIGCYRGAQQPAYVATHEKWLGERVEVVQDMLCVGGMTSWSPWTDPSRVKVWDGQPYELVFTVGLHPKGFTLADVAAGRHDDKWRSFTKGMVAAGRGDARIRLGHEFNHTWEPWTAANGRETTFAAAFRRVVDVTRSAGGKFRFTWCPLANIAYAQCDPAKAWPGDGFVDVIGLDLYDSRRGVSDFKARWQRTLTMPYGLNWLAAFAAKHGKPMAFDEWGLIKSTRPESRDPAEDSGDDTVYINGMFDWFASHDVAYATYFDVKTSHGYSDSRIHQPGGPYPNASAVYKKRVLART